MAPFSFSAATVRTCTNTKDSAVSYSLKSLINFIRGARKRGCKYIYAIIFVPRKELEPGGRGPAAVAEPEAIKYNYTDTYTIMIKAAGDSSSFGGYKFINVFLENQLVTRQFMMCF